MQLIANLPDISTELEAKCQSALNKRVMALESYSLDEIAKVSARPSRLSSATFAIDDASSDDLRCLCVWSTCSLIKPYQINSHRKFLGSAVVAAKKLAWRIIRAFLEGTFGGIQQFFINVVRSHFRLLNEVRELRAKVDEMSRSRNLDK